jgi:hypothetical protein
MPNFQWDTINLTDQDFQTNVDMRMPFALLKLLMRLGEVFFQHTPNGFVPSPDADEICKLIETRTGVPAANIAANAKLLKSAVKAAYDAHLLIQQPQSAAAVAP